MKFQTIILSAIVALAGASCSDYLDVKPSDRISEEVNFSSTAGFRQALNGVYIELNSESLYGRALSCGFVEIMAQRYAISAENKSATEIMNLRLGGSDALGTIQSIWGKAYNLISNVNLIIKNCEENRNVLSDEYYHIIKGEAYALRAYLHLDLFRLFGPIYNPETASPAIPYYESFSLDVAPTLSSHEFMGKVISDLKTAEEELQDDPIVRYGVSGKPNDLFLSYRNLRLNLYAVQGVLARAYFYMQDNANACEYARKIVKIQEMKFPWINPIVLTRSNVDRVFSSEIMFALQNLDRGNLYTMLFDANSLKPSTLLAPKDDVLKQVFEGSISTSDYRVKASLNNTVEVNNVKYRLFNKYQAGDSLYNQMIPMVRVSEAYLIIAQVSDDDSERLSVFETFRNSRGLQGETAARWLNHNNSLSSTLDKEWIKEFYGEGQLFFWYKRNSCTQMKSATDPYGNYSVGSLSKYVLALPDAESQYN